MQVRGLNQVVGEKDTEDCDRRGQRASALGGAGQSEIKGRALVFLTFGPDATSVTLYNPFHRGKTDAGTFELGTVQALERMEHIVGICHVKAYSVVTDEEHGLALLF